MTARLREFWQLPRNEREALGTPEAVVIAPALDAFATFERAELLAALQDALDNGLIYWEPNTSRGAVNKALMIERCRAAIARAGER